MQDEIFFSMKMIFLLFTILFYNCNMLPGSTEQDNKDKDLQSLLALSATSSTPQTSATLQATCNVGSATTCSSPPCLNICFRFNSDQERLGNTGQIASIPPGNAGQNPNFKLIAAHYYEISQNALTPLGGGSILFQPATVTDTSYPTNDVKRNAFNFADLNRTKEYDIALSVPIKNITPATYQYMRISLAYQEYDVSLRINNTVVGSLDFTGRLSSFVGVNTYITSYINNDETITVNGFKAQGYWYFNPASITVSGFPINPVSSTGQSPGTTVVNPIFATSPIPAGSCVVTNAFDSPITITGTETKDINIIASLSTNKSFEWRDLNGNGIWEPADGETVVDMGLRGIKFTVY